MHPLAGTPAANSLTIGPKITYNIAFHNDDARKLFAAQMKIEFCAGIRSRVFACFCMIMAAISSLVADGINFTNFADTSNFTFVDRETNGFNVLRLTRTNDPTSFGGVAWFNEQQCVTNGFVARFQFPMTPGSNAQGLAFVLQNAGLTNRGLQGETL